jgi:hypothetical protein
MVSVLCILCVTHGIGVKSRTVSHLLTYTGHLLCCTPFFMYVLMYDR